MSRHFDTRMESIEQIDALLLRSSLIVQRSRGLVEESRLLVKDSRRLREELQQSRALA